MSVLQSFDNTMNRYLGFLDNEYVRYSLILFLILYASLAAPALPHYVAKLFDYTWFKFVILFLIVFVGSKDTMVALIATIAVFVSLMTLNKYKLRDTMAIMHRDSDLARKYAEMGYDCKITCRRRARDDVGVMPIPEEDALYLPYPDEEMPNIPGMPDMPNQPGLPSMPGIMPDHGCYRRQMVGPSEDGVTTPMDGEQCFSKASLSELQESYEPHLVHQSNVPKAVDPGAYGFASVA